MWLRLSVIVVLSLFIAGCASKQLEENTLDVTSSIGDILRQQTIRNVAKQIVDPGMIPDHMDFSTGTIATQYQITPTFSDPLTSAITNTTAIAKAAATTVTDTTTRVANSKTSGVTAQHQWTQNWTVIPESNTRSLISLSLIYRFVVHQISEEQFKREFKSVNTYLYAKNAMRCVVCIPAKTADKRSGDFVNPRLLEIRDSLFWDAAQYLSRPPPSQAIRVGSYQGVTLYAAKPTTIRDLVFIVQDVVTVGEDKDNAASPLDVAAGSAGNGAGSTTASKKSSLIRGTTPTGDNVTIRPTSK
ncbi:MAG: hypothetical protein JSS20_06750 [Proteobacteria bacterium]|nr:hypothetical protein [Pseudomonadota bacterium]